MTKLAVVLFNLGGPDGQADVKPFLFNLFRDPAIIDLPAAARSWAFSAALTQTMASARRAAQRVMARVR